MIDDPDIEHAVERIEARLDQLHAELSGVRDDLAGLSGLLDALLEEARLLAARLESSLAAK